MRKVFLILLGLSFMLCACSSLKKTLGLERSVPDETQLETRQPLDMPPDMNELPN